MSSDLNKTLGGFNELLFAIPIFGGSGDKYTDIHPWHHIFFEAEQDLDSAVLLLLMGFYKDSFRSLRSFLELYIFALFNFVNEDKDNFQSWLNGKIGTPRLSELLKTLSKKNPYIGTLNEKLQWNTEVESLYRELSGFMHTRGAQYTHTSLRNSNLTGFSEVGIKTGTEFLLKAVRLAGMGFAANFPMSFQSLPLFDKFAFNQPAGGFLEEDQVERIKGIFQNDVSQVLLAISLSNDDANSLAEAIRAMPDLSEKEVFESLKKTLESEGFERSKKEILQMIKDGKVNEAFSYAQAIQRAMMRTMTMVLFNPFYESFANPKDGGIGVDPPATRKGRSP
ncbi:MAG: hypothetical protein Q8P17_04225 [bacterium]|nr:hypothetical protein [bacterium]